MNEKSRVTTQTNFLPDELIRNIKTECKNSKIHGLNLTDWDPSVVKTSGPILLYTLKDNLLNELLSVIKSKIHIPDAYIINYVRYTLGGRYSYLPWHDDNNHKLAITIYLNNVWDFNWGGFFIYKEGLDYKAVIPEYNKAIILEAPLPHCTVMPSIEAPLRESLQIFVDQP